MLWTTVWRLIAASLFAAAAVSAGARADEDWPAEMPPGASAAPPHVAARFATWRLVTEGVPGILEEVPLDAAAGLLTRSSASPVGATTDGDGRLLLGTPRTIRLFSL